MRVCPECDCEYVARAERCSDCGVSLIDRDEVEADAARTAPALPEGDYQALVRREAARELDPLAAALGAAGVAFNVKVQPGPGFVLNVRDEDRPAALTALREWLPELEQHEPAPLDDTDAGLRCPACDTPLLAPVGECPECGLGLTADEA